MKVVYDAANVIDAHLVRDALEAEDIPVFLKGEALVGGMGELPLFGVVQVCVPEAAWPRARSVVESLGLGEASASADPVEADGLGDGAPGIA